MPSYEERRAAAERKAEEARARLDAANKALRKLDKAERERDRRKRTSRLCKVGGAVDSYICSMEDMHFEAWEIAMARHAEEVQGWLEEEAAAGDALRAKRAAEAEARRAKRAARKGQQPEPKPAEEETPPPPAVDDEPAVEDWNDEDDGILFVDMNLDYNATTGKREVFWTCPKCGKSWWLKERHQVHGICDECGTVVALRR